MNNIVRVGKVKFPEYREISINMMPFIAGDKFSIPEEYRQYYGLIEACDLEEEEVGKVCFLTINESLVKKGNSQRRGGIHVEKTPTKAFGGGGWGGGVPSYAPPAPRPRPARRKRKPAAPPAPKTNPDDDLPPLRIKPKKAYRKGLYMASTIENSCRAWDMHVDVPGKLGDCEHLRKVLKNPIMLKGSELYWMTDSCPHEALPSLKDTLRQFFRVVSSDVDVWYRQHSTPNRLGIEPTCEIFEGNKFEN
jgi:hypothetical protein